MAPGSAMINHKKCQIIPMDEVNNWEFSWCSIAGLELAYLSLSFGASNKDQTVWVRAKNWSQVLEERKPLCKEENELFKIKVLASLQLALFFAGWKSWEEGSRMT